MVMPLVPGQATAKQIFERAIEQQRLAHAYLIVGPVGRRRLTFSLELAKCLLCEQGDPCGVCTSCRSVDDGNHPGVHCYGPQEGKHVVDIETIRRLCERTHFRRDHLQVLIVDGADLMNEPAANALLKTLEEPPPSVLLLLLAQSAGALLTTIVSRCHRVPFIEVPEPPEAFTLEQHSLLALPLSREFFAETDPKDWLRRLVPEASTNKEALRRVLEILTDLFRNDLGMGSGDFDAGLKRLDDLLSLRDDLNRNINADLVLERLLKVVRTAGAIPGI